MAQKQNRRAKIVGTDIELDISEKKDVVIESHDDNHGHDHHHKESHILNHKQHFEHIYNYHIEPSFQTDFD